jgi:hypothetical protein
MPKFDFADSIETVESSRDSTPGPALVADSPESSLEGLLAVGE